MAKPGFHITEILGGVAGVVIVAILVQPTPVLLALVAFFLGQVVTRTVRKMKGF
jgi:hypothetical protein